MHLPSRYVLPALAIALVSALSLGGISVPASAAPVVPSSAVVDPGAPSSAVVDPGAPSPTVVDLGNDEVAIPTSEIPQVARKHSTAEAKAAATTQVHTIWISVATISRATTQPAVAVPANETAARAFVAQLNSYWNRESGGKISLAFGGFETRALDSSCNLNAIYSASENAAFSGTFSDSQWAGSYKHLLTLSTKECGTGLGSVGVDGGLLVSGLGSSASLGLPTVLHEFGHNLGFSHGNASICAASTFDASTSTFARSCATSEYSDYLDIMGYTVRDSVPHLSSPQRIRTGYMGDYSTLSSGTTTATIKPLGTDGTSGIRALAVTDPDGETYYVEYRVTDNADANSAEYTGPTTCATYASSYSRCYMDTEGSIGGVRILRVSASGAPSSVETRLLAIGPLNSGGSATRRDTHLDAGESFTNYDDDLTITVNSVNATTGASVTVAFGPRPPAPVVSPTPTPTRTAVTPAPVVTPPVVPTPVVTPLVTTPTTTPTATAPAPAPKIVTKSRTKTTVVLVKKKVSKTARAKAKVRVTYGSGKAPTGTLAVYANKKKLGSYRLTAKAKGRVTISIPQLRTGGTYSIRVVYKGNSLYTTSRSTAKKLTAR